MENIRNQDKIGKNEILVVSLGTTITASRIADIQGIEDALQEAYPEWSVRRAFTSQTIISRIQEREGLCIDNLDRAMKRAAANRVQNLVLQPTYMIPGTEYDELKKAIEAYREMFGTVTLAKPLLGAVETDISTSLGDLTAVAGALTAGMRKNNDTACVLIGHGTIHKSKIAYSQMQTVIKRLGYDNVLIGTVTGDPEETACRSVLESAAKTGCSNVILRPFMVSAGKHANSDIAGSDRNSWLSIFSSSGRFETVTAEISGLGSVRSIQQVYVKHTKEAILVKHNKICTRGFIKEASFEETN